VNSKTSQHPHSVFLAVLVNSPISTTLHCAVLVLLVLSPIPLDQPAVILVTLVLINLVSIQAAANSAAQVRMLLSLQPHIVLIVPLVALSTSMVPPSYALLVTTDSINHLRVKQTVFLVQLVSSRFHLLVLNLSVLNVVQVTTNPMDKVQAAYNVKKVNFNSSLVKAVVRNVLSASLPTHGVYLHAMTVVRVHLLTSQV